MKQFYILGVIMLTSLSINAQIVNIPDANFKNALVNTICIDTDDDGFLDSDADLNDDGEIQVSEAEAVLNLEIAYNNISSLQGIESFVNLQNLECQYNQLTTLDVSDLANLTFLDCQHNDIATIDISGLTNLIELKCYSNLITTLELTGLTNLKVLKCGENRLTSLDVTGLSNLELLYCYWNELTTLEVSGLSNLTELRCHNNFLSSIDLSGLESLIVFVANVNQFIALDLSGLPNLTSVNCSNNQLLSLDESVLTNLTSLYCSNNLITTLDVSGIHDLYYFDCSGNQLVSLFMKNGSTFSSVYSFELNPNLEFICVDDEEFNDVLIKVAEYGYTNCNVNGYCSFVPGGYYSIIEGIAKLDFNNDGCDITDPTYPRLKLNSTNTSGNLTGIYISNSSGQYSVPFQEGLYEITPILESPNYFAINPESFVVDFPTDTSPYVQDFCITPIGDFDDLEITIIPLEAAVPGFDTDYKILYKNKGTTTLSGTLDLIYNQNNELMDFVSAIPNIDTDIANVLTWSYSNIQPFESREILITFNLNSPTETPPLNAGDDLGFEAFIYPNTTDETPSDNNIDLKQTVVNSYDPNDKTCLEGQTITPEQVGKFVHYLIRFENLGTASAVNIVVKDEIDLTKYDVSTLIPLDGSHEFVTRIKDDNIVEFIFENINLPFDDANNDGYVLFKIKTLNSLILGDAFSNDAEIYFDYNFPIITNDETTTVAVLSTEEFEFVNNLTLYPNPTSNNLYIEASNTLNSVEIYNLLGQQVLSTKPNTLTEEIDMSKLNSGMYLVKVTIGEQTATYKVMKE